jgi:hypothetical protein
VFTVDYTHKLLLKGSLEHRASSFRKKCDFSDQEALEGQATSQPKTLLSNAVVLSPYYLVLRSETK